MRSQNLSLILLSFISFSILPLATACSSNNCLNALKRYSASASPFCSTYTQGISTATTSLPSYVTACTNEPSKISSACSCLITPTPTPTCVASSVVDPYFISASSGADTWTVTINQDPAQNIAPAYGFTARTGFGLFEANFPDFQPDPFLSTVTLSQDNIRLCNGQSDIGYYYASSINAIAANPVPEESNCTITSGFVGFPASTLVTAVPWAYDTPPPYLSVDQTWTVSGLPAAGSLETFYLTVECTLADWWPEVDILNPNVNLASFPAPT